MAQAPIYSQLNSSKSLTLGELALRVEGMVEGNSNVLVHGVSSIEDAIDGDLVFAESPRYFSQAERSSASAILAFLEAVTEDKPLIRVKNPREAFTHILHMFAPKLNAPVGIHPSAQIGKDVVLGDKAGVGAAVVIGDRVQIGNGTVVFAGSVIGEDCS